MTYLPTLQHPDARIGEAVINNSRVAFALLVLSDYTSEGEYNKTDWNDGDLITEALIDKIENVIYDNRHDINSIKKLASYFQVTTDYLLEQDGDDAYMLDIFKKLEYLDKDKLLGITKSIITDLLGNLTEEENVNKKIKKK